MLEVRKETMKERKKLS